MESRMDDLKEVGLSIRSRYSDAQRRMLVQRIEWRFENMFFDKVLCAQLCVWKRRIKKCVAWDERFKVKFVG